MQLLPLLFDIRVAIGDAQQVNVSDYQIMSALNSVIRQTNKILSNMTSDLTKSKTTLTLTGGEVALPADFQAIISITDENNVPLTSRTTEADTVPYIFELLDGKIIAPTVSAVILRYKKFFTDVSLEYDVNNAIVDKTLPLPDFFRDLLVNHVKEAIVTGIVPVIKDEAVKTLVAGRDKGRLYTKMPFRI
jgi:hypothetical protein